MRPNVALSSTFLDLAEHRQIAVEGLHRVGMSVQLAENEPAGAGDVIETSLRYIDNADAAVFIIGWRYGAIPEDPVRNPDRLSLQEIEFRRAVQRGIPILVFVLGPKYPVSVDSAETVPANVLKLNAFRETLKTGGVYTQVNSFHEFTGSVFHACAQLSQSLNRSHSTDERAPPRSRGLFVSYRRASSSHAVGRMCDHLSAEFGEDQIFLDVDAVPIGRDFRAFVDETISKCRVFLAVVSTDWRRSEWSGLLTMGRRDDHLLSEVEAAFAAQVAIVPVLIDDAQMPKAHTLPKSIRAISYLNAARLRSGKDFREDMAAVTRAVKFYFDS